MAAPLKEGLNQAAVARLAKNLARSWPPFETKRFVRKVVPGLGSLELKERVAHVADTLARFLPDDYLEALGVLTRTKDTWDPGNESDPLRGFTAWPLFHFIETRGTEYFAESMEALRVLTPLFTAEFAVRPFVEKHRKRSLRLMTKWARDKDKDVRRLASEGTRPRLPWATKIQALIDEPSAAIPILEQLKDDPEEYVRRSVSNHLSDIAKSDPDLVIDLCTTWLDESPSKERRWIVERATRTLVKQGHPRVWGLLGYEKSPKLAPVELKLRSRTLKMGAQLQLSFELSSASKKTQRLVVDYAVHFMKSDGNLRPKVFKLKSITLRPGETMKLNKAHRITPISTRKYYPGRHLVEVTANGVSLGSVHFDLKT